MVDLAGQRNLNIIQQKWVITDHMREEDDTQDQDLIAIRALRSITFLNCDFSSDAHLILMNSFLNFRLITIYLILFCIHLPLLMSLHLHIMYFWHVIHADLSPLLPKLILDMCNGRPAWQRWQAQIYGVALYEDRRGCPEFDFMG